MGPGDGGESASRAHRSAAPPEHLTLRGGERVEVRPVDDGHGVTLIAAAGGKRVGVGRYVRVGQASDAPEVAVAVVEGWHRRGVASALLSRLCRHAEGCGRERFRVTCLAPRGEAVALLREAGAAILREVNEELVELRLELPPRVGYGAPLSHLLRSAAAGGVTVSGPPLIAAGELDGAE